MGTVSAISEQDATESGGNGWTVTIGDAAPVLGDCKLGDSIFVNGACLTVTEFDSASFKVGLAPETLSRTDLGACVAMYASALTLQVISKSAHASTSSGRWGPAGAMEGTSCRVTSM